MKKTILGIIFILACLLCACGNESASEKTGKEASTEIFRVYFDIDYEANLLLSKYDVKVLLDDKQIGSIKNGEHFNALQEANAGSHVLAFQKSGDTTVTSKETFVVKEDITFQCSIKSRNSEIKVKDVKISSGREESTSSERTSESVEETNKTTEYEADIETDKAAETGSTVPSEDNSEIEMDNVVGMVLKEALQLLRDKGFTNVTYKSTESKMIFDTGNWTVVLQNVPKEKRIDRNDEIELSCRKTEDYIENLFKGLFVSDAVEIAGSIGYDDIQFKNLLDDKDITGVINTLPVEEVSGIQVEAAKLVSSKEKALEFSITYVTEIVMPDVLYKQIEEACELFDNLGVPNVKLEDIYGLEVYREEDLYIAGQNVEPGEKIKTDTEIVLICVEESWLPKNRDKDESSSSSSSDASASTIDDAWAEGLYGGHFIKMWNVHYPEEPILRTSLTDYSSYGTEIRLNDFLLIHIGELDGMESYECYSSYPYSEENRALFVSYVNKMLTACDYNKKKELTTNELGSYPAELRVGTKDFDFAGFYYDEYEGKDIVFSCRIR